MALRREFKAKLKNPGKGLGGVGTSPLGVRIARGPSPSRKEVQPLDDRTKSSCLQRAMSGRAWGPNTKAPACSKGCHKTHEGKDNPPRYRQRHCIRGALARPWGKDSAHREEAMSFLTDSPSLGGVAPNPDKHRAQNFLGGNARALRKGPGETRTSQIPQTSNSKPPLISLSSKHQRPPPNPYLHPWFGFFPHWHCPPAPYPDRGVLCPQVSRGTTVFQGEKSLHGGATMAPDRDLYRSQLPLAQWFAAGGGGLADPLWGGFFIPSNRAAVGFPWGSSSRASPPSPHLPAITGFPFVGLGPSLLHPPLSRSFSGGFPEGAPPGGSGGSSPGGSWQAAPGGSRQAAPPGSPRRHPGGPGSSPPIPRQAAPRKPRQGVPGKILGRQLPASSAGVPGIFGGNPPAIPGGSPPISSEALLREVLGGSPPASLRGAPPGKSSAAASGSPRQAAPPAYPRRQSSGKTSEASRDILGRRSSPGKSGRQSSGSLRQEIPGKSSAAAPPASPRQGAPPGISSAGSPPDILGGAPPVYWRQSPGYPPAGSPPAYPGRQSPGDILGSSPPACLEQLLRMSRQSSSASFPPAPWGHPREGRSVHASPTVASARPGRSSFCASPGGSFLWPGGEFFPGVPGEAFPRGKGTITRGVGQARLIRASWGAGEIIRGPGQATPSGGPGQATTHRASRGGENHPGAPGQATIIGASRAGDDSRRVPGRRRLIPGRPGQGRLTGASGEATIIRRPGRGTGSPVRPGQARPPARPRQARLIPGRRGSDDHPRGSGEVAPSTARCSPSPGHASPPMVVRVHISHPPVFQTDITGFPRDGFGQTERSRCDSVDRSLASVSPGLEFPGRRAPRITFPSRPHGPFFRPLTWEGPNVSFQGEIVPHREKANHGYLGPPHFDPVNIAERAGMFGKATITGSYCAPQLPRKSSEGQQCPR
ncbi:collagen alpha-1(I) chain-like [Penaeus monodon]|uniref:collagen alpha-1(I) chain-like n=1 Tax=Penaeus monodon TaxID=6687 RepID=UPI0018A71B52|nr:collagen alpha-1(I) chain-like [Penaeus monodon]